MLHKTVQKTICVPDSHLLITLMSPSFISHLKVSDLWGFESVNSLSVVCFPAPGHQPAVFDILILHIIKICHLTCFFASPHFSLSGLILKAAAAAAAAHWAFPVFEQLSECKGCSNSFCMRRFRPPRCYKWLFSGLSGTAWRFFCCSSLRARWSSSTRRPGSRWCWTNTWWPEWTGWCRPSGRSPQSLLGAPEGNSRIATHHDPQRVLSYYSHTDWLHCCIVICVTVSDWFCKLKCVLDSVWK